VHPHQGEESYLLSVLRHYFPEFQDISRGNMLTSWTGLRVLPSGAGHVFHRSRETVLYTDRVNRPRLLSIYGGKLTTYRATAGKVVERISTSLPNTSPRASTRELPLRPA